MKFGTDVKQHLFEIVRKSDVCHLPKEGFVPKKVFLTYHFILTIILTTLLVQQTCIVKFYS